MTKKKSTLLFLHGWATDGWVWKQQINAIRNTRKYYNLNLPGHGGKKKWDEPDLTPPVEEVLNHILPSNPEGFSYTGIGWSLGAQALLLAAIEKKIKFNSLIITGATPCFVKKDDFPWAQPMSVVKKMIKDMKKKPCEAVNRFYRLNFTEEELETENAKHLIDRYTNNETSFEYDEITVGLEALSKTDLRNKLDLLDIPVLIIHGKMDQICPADSAYYLAEKIKGAELIVFEKAGHVPFITESGKFNKLMIDFLNK